MTGCSRQHFRERADRDVEQLISEKNVVPQWQVQNWHTYPDLRSRFADPSSPDFPPYPPDDYAARTLAPNPQRPGKGGSGRHEGDGYYQQIVAWDAQNRTESAADGTPELPKPNIPEQSQDETSLEKQNRDALTANEYAYRLKLDQTVDLALFNSREFQDRREDLYLAALPVSLERFNFSAQWAATEQLIVEAAGRDVAGTGGGGSKMRVGLNNQIGRNFATGATLLVSLANQIVIDISDNKPTVSISNLGLSFVQPILRGAGFAVTLEALTQAERTLVYAIRSYARFRSVFYNSIVAGGDNTNNPYGLQGLSANLGRGIGANLTARPAGYLPTALRGAILANELKNVATIEEFLQQFQNSKEGGGVPDLQVKRVEQRLLSSRALVLRRQQEYADILDNFKLQLGVPATLPIQLDETPLKPIRKQLQRFEDVYQQIQDFEKVAGKFDANEAPAQYRQRFMKVLTESPLAKGTSLGKNYPKTAQALAKLTPEELEARIMKLREDRRKYLDAKAARQLKRQSESAEQLALIERIEAELDRLRFEQQLRKYESAPWLKLPNDRRVGEQASAFRATLEAGMLVALQLRTERLESIRAEWPVLPTVYASDTDLLTTPLEQGYSSVTQEALKNRYDLMNARAQVVDQWRRITVAANSLQSVFDVGYDLATTTPAGADKPFSFGGSRVLHQIRLRFEPGFVRRAERNNYRAQLIAYQRQRRNLQAFEDNIVTDARSNLRTIRQLAQAYQVQLRAVEIAYSQVENARSTFLAPPDPRVQDTAGNVAALTQQLLEAQGQLVSAQNDLYTTWTNYQAARINLLLDMELITLDARGQWNDDAASSLFNPAAIPGSGAQPAPAPGGNGREPERLPAPARINADPLPPIQLPAIP